MMNWYAACTHPRHEKKAAEHLSNTGVESFLPTYHAVHRWRNGVQAFLELPLFPGYIFVRILPQDWLQVVKSPSVTRLIGFQGTPSPLSECEIERLRSGVSVLNAEPHPFLRVGERVRIKAGPLTGLEGTLVSKKGKWRFVLSIELIMQAISVEVESSDVEALQPVSPMPVQYSSKMTA